MRPHTARHIEANAASGHHAVVIRIECSDSADRKAVSPMGIRHGVSCTNDPRKRGDVFKLFRNFLVHVADEALAAIDDRRHAHRLDSLYLPGSLGQFLNLRDVHGLGLLKLDIDDALGAPFPWPILDNGKFRQCRAFDLNGRVVPLDRDGFPRCDAVKAATIDRHAEVPENHASRRYLEDERVQPVDKQKLSIRSSALDIDRFGEVDFRGIGHDGRHGKRRLLEGLFQRWPYSADADVCIVRKMGCFQNFTFSPAFHQMLHRA